MGHPSKRCDTCEFWDTDDQWGGGKNDERHPDDRIGNCHRNAPPATLGEFEYELLHLLSLVSWDHANEEEKKEEFMDWEESMLVSSSWPGTHGQDWCGEWKPKILSDPGGNGGLAHPALAATAMLCALAILLAACQVPLR